LPGLGGLVNDRELKFYVEKNQSVKNDGVGERGDYKEPSARKKKQAAWPEYAERREWGCPRLPQLAFSVMRDSNREKENIGRQGSRNWRQNDRGRNEKNIKNVKRSSGLSPNKCAMREATLMGKSGGTVVG